MVVTKLLDFIADAHSNQIKLPYADVVVSGGKGLKTVRPKLYIAAGMSGAVPHRVGCETGALLICETTVNELIMDNNQVVGVQCDRLSSDVYADIVILADGVNSTLPRKAGFHPEIPAGNVALAVKEILFMSEETKRQRFNIGEESGIVREMVGRITDGMMGTGFLYTNKESITIGVGCMLSYFKANSNKTTPYAQLDQMKRHPSIAPLIESGEMNEYCAHLIPEGGLHAIPQIYGNGWMIVGDSGGFVSSVHREGSNLAMTTGRLAAEAAIAIKAEPTASCSSLADFAVNNMNPGRPSSIVASAPIFHRARQGKQLFVCSHLVDQRRQSGFKQ